MREAVRLIWDLVEPGWDLVWVARPAIRGATFTEIQEACIRLLRRARILKPVAPLHQEESVPVIERTDEAG
jgi:ribonuclease P protein component